MRRLIWPLVVFVICLPVAVLALGVPLPFLDRSTGLPRPLPVPDGDQELAWLHTTTNATTWERFVNGVVRAQLLVPGLRVDDSAAFSDQTTGVPELVLSMDGRPGRVRIRWYKLATDATASQWVSALAARDRPPLALIGGGSSDRAVDLARALDQQKTWNGDRPLLLITTATADEVPAEARTRAEGAPMKYSVNLLDVYDDRSFRFCFTNRQMAESVLDFVWAHPRLRPGPVLEGRAAAGSGLALAVRPKPDADDPPDVLGVVWNDDPFSRDLHERFADAIRGKANIETWEVQYSIGGFTAPNFYEARVAESILERCRVLDDHRSLIVLSTVTQPARRLMRSILERDPSLRDRLVAVTGDGIPVNAIYRDGSFAWPVHSIPIPLVLFTHHNPVGWDEEGQSPPPSGYELQPPNSTEEALHFADLARVVVEACYGGAGKSAQHLTTRADELAVRLRNRSPAMFDAEGNRLGGTGEYVVVLWPRNGETFGRDLPDGTLEVWRRGPGPRWEHVRTIPVTQRRTPSRSDPLVLGMTRGGRPEVDEDGK